jgi:hypothetical protein
MQKGKTMARQYQEGQRVIVNSDTLLYENEPATIIYTDRYNSLIQVEIDSDGGEWYLDQNEVSPMPRQSRQSK